MDNLFKATKRESAVDIVVNSIKQLLADKKLLPGDKLPNELEISEGLGVSRGSVREAMKPSRLLG
ncbi:MAG: FadR/GntR family transcriptional regulator [[Clostridium] scindens]